jgi:hypothetical protein
MLSWPIIWTARQTGAWGRWISAAPGVLSVALGAECLGFQH